MAAAQSLHVLVGLGALALGQAGSSAVDPLATVAKMSGRELADCAESTGDFKCTFDGLVLPLFGDSEKDWPNAIRVILYLMGLGWTFLGIAIISDVFMNGIEKVTSWKKRVKDKDTGRTVTIYVWNATVANLTLMALGSSAPEILLSLIEITADNMFLGELGAGTIVGSAAFNLLIISAVCVCAIPEPEVRYIQQTSVYIITASCSVLAYMWLMFILMATSPNVCEVWEALLTLIFCPLLVLAAYWADKGYFDRKTTEEKTPLHTIPDDVTQDELAQIEQQIRESTPGGAELTSDQVVQIMGAKYFTQRSRAYYRHAAVQMHVHGNQKVAKMVVRNSVAPPNFAVSEAVTTTDDVAKDKKDRAVSIGFEFGRYAFLEDCGSAVLTVLRSGPTHCRCVVKYKTRDGTATDRGDYEPTEGTVTFEKDETRKTISIKIHDDNAYEENEEFYVDLMEPTVEDSASCAAVLSEVSTVTVIIIDDDHPGTLSWLEEEVTVEEEVEGCECEITISRVGGASGTVSCKYETENMNAIAGMDYEPTSGKVELGPSVQSATVKIPIKPKGRFDKTASFIVRLTDPQGCEFDKETDGGKESCVCHVTIKGKSGDTAKNVIARMHSNVQSQQAILGHRHWREQFYDALFKVVDDDDEDDEDEGAEGEKVQKKAAVTDYIMHFFALPWKVLFAFVPPVDYCGGWACFFGALCMIAVVTAIVGDIANLVGCCMGIEPEITAITFVALGTSLPDTFASKTAACMDPYADASIGNVTGSNCVNVFLGLGISWSLAAIYWEMGTPTDEWNARVNVPGGLYYDIREDVHKAQRGSNAVFVVPAGSLWFNLMVFSANALFAIQHLFARRKKFGGELGGPRRGFMGQYFSASFLIGQWVIYIAASSIMATMNAADKDC
jgi:solute carrier family 8 (sodium/calcium exchanger)